MADAPPEPAEIGPAPPPAAARVAGRSVRLRLTPRAIGVIVGGALLGILARNVFVAAHRPIGWAVACAVVALLVEPVIAVLDRHLPRILAVVVTVLAVALAAIVISVGIVRDLGESVQTLEQTAPEAARRLEERSDVARDFRTAERVDSFISGLDERIRGDTVGRAVGTVPTYVVTGILMLFFLAYGRRFVRGGLDQIADPARRARAEQVLRATVSRGRAYLLTTLFQVLVIAVNAWVVYRLVDLPAALVLALVTGAWSAVPYLGVLIGGLPALLLAAGLHGSKAGVPVGAALIGLQLIEALIVRPRVDSRTVHVGPALPLFVVLVAFELYGIGGSVYAFAILVLALAALDAVAERPAA